MLFRHPFLFDEHQQLCFFTKSSNAAVMDGYCEVGASMSNRSPASLAAWAVAGPNVPMAISFCSKSGKVFQQSLYTRGAEENQHVVIELLVALEIVAHGAVHYHFLVDKLLGIQQVRDFVVVYIRQRNQIFFCFMLDHRREQIVHFCP